MTKSAKSNSSSTGDECEPVTTGSDQLKKHRSTSTLRDAAVALATAFVVADPRRVGKSVITRSTGDFVGAEQMVFDGTSAEDATRAQMMGRLYNAIAAAHGETFV